MAKLRTLFTAAVLLGAVFGILADPAGAFRSSLAGLRLWWDVVFPAMFPFLTLAELLNAGGILKAAGAMVRTDNAADARAAGNRSRGRVARRLGGTAGGGNAGRQAGRRATDRRPPSGTVARSFPSRPSGFDRICRRGESISRRPHRMVARDRPLHHGDLHSRLVHSTDLEGGGSSRAFTDGRTPVVFRSEACRTAARTPAFVRTAVGRRRRVDGRQTVCRGRMDDVFLRNGRDDPKSRVGRRGSRIVAFGR